ncbi:transcriptional repressor [Clostridium sp. 'deep sea']|uniref:Fur family transcriptional regulator n=1 Tax=Clostridium sp. 'deep sea' TaxID=2779445 RepID=UPI00189689D2|nr:Fur family transcriptional regulator [Clostridium sp. 'deep sea']QOR34901.1 transcriptional repressor [Clostridium sp. 'deep sea']
MDISLHNFKSLLDQYGYRITNSRLIIYNVFSKYQNKHLTLADVFHYCKLSSNSIGIATVYRTARIFENIGFIKKIDLGDNSSCYEVVRENNDHFHLKCRVCNQIIEVEQSISIAFKNQILAEMGFGITEFNLINGICKQCRAKLAAL